MKSKAFFSSFFLLISHTVFSSTISSIKDGFWNDSSTWSSGTIPKSIDSIYINNFVSYFEAIEIDSIGLIMVEQNGVLCGHANIYSKCGGFFYNYNLVQADSLWLTDGSNYGLIMFLKYFKVSPCKQTFALGANKGGYPFFCDPSDTTDWFNVTHDTLTITTPKPKISISIFPNPALDYFNINSSIPDSNSVVTLNIFDLIGRTIKTISIPSGNSVLTVYINDWATGIYLLRFTERGTSIKVEKLIKVQ